MSSRGRDIQVALGKQPVHAEPPLVVLGIGCELVIVAGNVFFSIVLDRSRLDKTVLCDSSRKIG